MYGLDLRRHDHLVEITILLDATDPPAGRVSFGGRELVFVGWLGLLRVLSDLLQPADQ